MNRLLTTICWIALCVPPVLWLGTCAPDPFVTAAEPAPVALVGRRILLDPTQPDFEVWRGKQGPLIQMPRDEFETLLRKAEQGRKQRTSAPRLLEAVYRARLVEPSKQGARERLVPEPCLVGSGEWKVQAATLDDPLLPLVPFSLALKHIRFENREAQVGDCDGQPVLWLDKSGEQSVTLDWTTRGDESPDGYHFDWQVPASPVALLELEAPSGRVVQVAPDSCLLTGPFAAETPGHSLWKIRFAGRTQLHLVVGRAVPAPAKDAAPLLLRQAHDRFTLRPDGVQSEFQLEVQRLDRAFQDLVLLPDPELQPYQVLADHLERWELQPAKDNQPAQLRLHFSEPMHGVVTVRVRCLSSLGKLKSRAAERSGLDPSTGWEVRSWSVPAMRLVGGIPRQESLEFRCHPDLQIQEWHAGGYRVTDTQTETTGQLRIVAHGAGVPGEPATLSGPRGVARARPSLTLLQRGALYHVRQNGWWQVQPRQNLLTVQLEYEIQHGRLADVPLLIPAEWDIEQVESIPRDAVRTWSVRPAPVEMLPQGVDRTRSMLVVELQRPFQGATQETEGDSRSAPLVLRVELRGRNVPGLRSVWTQSFPDLLPLGAQSIESGLGIEFDEDLSAPTYLNAVQPGTIPEGGPWGTRVPDTYFAQRGHAVTGRLRLSPRGVLFSTKALCNVRYAATQATIEARLELEALSGIVDTVDLVLSTPSPGPWQWTVLGGNPAWMGTSQPVMERKYLPEALRALSLLTVHQPLTAVCPLAATPRSEHWRLRLPAPLPVGERLRLLTRWEVPTAQPTLPTLEVPLITVVGSGRAEGEVRIHPIGVLPATIETTGLAPVPRPLPTSPALPWRTYRHTEGLARLLFRGQALTADTSPQIAAPAMIDEAMLRSRLDRNGRRTHVLTFRVLGWEQPSLPVRLPPGCVPGKARVQGLEITSYSWHESESNEVRLPVPRAEIPLSERSIHVFELVYTEQGSPWSFLTVVEQQKPILPLAPLRFVQRWHLPAGIVPVDQERLQVLPAPGSNATAWFELPFRPLVSNESTQPTIYQETIIDAQLRLRNLLARGEGTLTLGELLDSLGQHALPNMPLIVDGTALSEAGLSPRTPVARPTPTSGDLLESAGVTVLPIGNVLLVTSLRQRDAWQRQGLLRGRADAGLAQAVTSALLEARDPLGRFYRLVDWLRQEALVAGAALTLDWADWNAENEPGFVWEESGADAASDLWLIRADVPLLAGCGLAVLFVLLCLLLQRRAAATWRSRQAGQSTSSHPRLIEESPDRIGLISLLLWIGSMGLLTLWLPATLRPTFLPAFLIGCGCAVLQGVRQLRQARRPRLRVEVTMRPPSTTSAVNGLASLLVGFVLLGTGLWAQEPAKPTVVPVTPATVYLLPGPREAPEKQTVLLTPALHAQLQQLSKPVKIPARAVIVRSSYQARIVQGNLWIDAEYQVFCPDAGAVVLLLPLEGVTLRDDVLLDGARAYPQARPKPETGYSLKLSSQGLHKIALPMTVPIKESSGGWREVRFEVPRALTSQFKLVELPDTVEAFQAVTKCGQQVLLEENTKPVVQVELGPVQVIAVEKAAKTAVPIQLRWRQDQGPVVANPTIKFKEAYLWDLSTEGHRLRGVLEYQIGPGAVRSLVVEVPPGLQVTSVEARRPAGKPGDVPVRLRQWLVTRVGTTRELQLDFQGPISDGVEIVLTFVPTTTLEENPPTSPRTTQPAVLQLLLPEPRGQLLADGESYLGYRLVGLQGLSFNPLRVTGIDVREFPPFLGLALGEKPVLDYAARLKREPGKPPQLRVRVAAPTSTWSARQQAVWHTEVGHLDLRLTAEITAPAKELSLLEWDVPQGMVITQVTGVAVRQWSQFGERLQVWLGRTSEKAELRLAGYSTVPSNSAGLLQREIGRTLQGCTPQAPFVTAAYSLVSPVPTLLVSTPQPRGSSRVQGQVTVASSTRWTVQIVHGNDWQTLPRTVAGAQVQSSRTQPAPLLVQLLPQPPLKVQVLRVVEKSASTIRYLVHLSGAAPGSLVDVEILGLPGSDVVWELSGATRRRETPLGAGDRRLRLEIHSRLLLSTGVTLTTRLPIEPGTQEIAVPQVRVLEAEHQEESLALLGIPWNPTARGGVRPVNALRTWPAESERIRRAGGSLWQVENTASVPHTLMLEPLTARNQVTVLHQEHSLIQGMDARWAHQSQFILHYHEANIWWVTLPGDGQLVGLNIDGAVTDRTLHRRATGDGRRIEIGIPLSAEAATRTVTLTWRNMRETAYHPDWQVVAPLDSPVAVEPPQWQLTLSPGTRLTPPEPRGSGPAALRLIERAEAHGEGCRLLVQAGTTGEALRREWLRGQQRLELASLLAERLLTAAHAAGELDPVDKQRLDTRLSTLRTLMDALAGQHGLQTALQTLRREVEEVILGRQPQPTPELRADLASLTALAPTLDRTVTLAAHLERDPPRLSARADERWQGLVMGTLLLLGLLVVLWAFATVPALATLLQTFWPEQVAVLGLLGGLTLGWGWLTIFLVALGLCGRILFLFGRSVAAFRQRSRSVRSVPFLDIQEPVPPASDA